MDDERLNLLLDSLGPPALLPFVQEGAAIFERCSDELLACLQAGRFADLRALAHLRRGQAATLGCTHLAQALEEIETLASQETEAADPPSRRVGAIAPVALETVAALRGFTKRLGA